MSGESPGGAGEGGPMNARMSDERLAKLRAEAAWTVDLWGVGLDNGVGECIDEIDRLRAERDALRARVDVDPSDIEGAITLPQALAYAQAEGWATVEAGEGLWQIKKGRTPTLITTRHGIDEAVAQVLNNIAWRDRRPPLDVLDEVLAGQTSGASS